MTDPDETPRSETASEEKGVETPNSTDLQHNEIHQPTAKVEADASTTATATSTEEEVTKEEPSEEGETLEKFLEGEDETTIKKVVLHPDTQDGDIVLKENGEHEIHAEHVFNDIDKLFGDKSNPKLFFSILKNTPRKADEIAKVCGWRSKHYMKAAIEDYIAAPDSQKSDILQKDFPEWTWASDVEPPFTFEGKKGETAKPTSAPSGEFSKSDVTRAVNDYVAENEGVTKDSILKSATVKKLLEEFSEFQVGGKRITVDKALKMAISQTTLQKQPAKKAVKASLGAGAPPKQTKTAGGVSTGAAAMAKSLGYNIKATK